MGKGRYAMVVNITQVVAGFTNYPESVPPEFTACIDLQNHPQAEEIEEGWFYDETTDTFSIEGEIVYPEPDRHVSQLDRIEQNTAALLENESVTDILLGVNG